MQAPFDQADAATLYEQMRPDQRTAIALEFVRCLRHACFRPSRRRRSIDTRLSATATASPRSCAIR